MSRVPVVVGLWKIVAGESHPAANVRFDRLGLGGFVRSRRLMLADSKAPF
jgi:hypothetical protein